MTSLGRWQAARLRGPLRTLLRKSRSILKKPITMLRLEENMKIYVYSIPKSGTYFIADFLGRVGFTNTGYHVMANYFLDTHSVDLAVNASTPAAVMKSASFVQTLRLVPPRGVAFGHFPAPYLPDLIPRYTFICAYRHPRKTLLSEFVDFRFRRTDIDWLASDAVISDQDAFCLYLERHGPSHMRIFSEMLGVATLVQDELFVHMDPQRFHFVNFDHVLADSKAMTQLGRRLGVSADDARRAYAETLSAETKTKATNIGIDRNALWSPAAERAYRDLGAEAYVKRGKALGWAF